MSTIIDDCTRFLEDLILGDFNENQMVSAQIIGGLISLIPVVDQVMDVRDVSGSLYRINKHGGFKHASLDAKVDLGFAAFGIIPEIGSAFKTVFKPLYKQRKAAKGAIAGGVAMIERMLGQKKGGAVRWVKTLDWAGNTNDAIYKANLALDSCVMLLDQVAANPWWCPDELAHTAQSVRPGIVSLRGQLAAPIREASVEIKGFLEEMLGEHAAAVALGALENAGGGRSGRHSQSHAGGATARKKVDTHKELQSKPRIKGEKKTGTVINVVQKLSYAAYDTLNFMEKGLVGEHIVDHHIIEQKGWGLDWNQHDMIGGGTEKKKNGWQAVCRKLNDDEIPMYLCTPSVRVLLRGIDSAWLTNRVHPQEFAIVEAKANPNPNIRLINLLGEARHRDIDAPLPTRRARKKRGGASEAATPSRGAPKPPAKVMQMSRDWIEFRVKKELRKDSRKILRLGRNYSRHVMLVTPMQTLEHVHALKMILTDGLLNNPIGAQKYAKQHAKHDVQREFGEAEIDEANREYISSGKPKKPVKKAPGKGKK